MSQFLSPAFNRRRDAWGGDWPEPPPGFGFSLLIWLAPEVKKAVDLIGSGREAQAALGAGAADLIAVGRAMLADPDWAAKALAGRDEEIRLCERCRRCARFLPRRACPARTGHDPAAP